MSASEFAGLTAAATGGASGIGRATSRLPATCVARVAHLDPRSDGAPPPLVGIPAYVADDVAVRRLGRPPARAADHEAELAALDSRQQVGRLIVAEKVSAIAYRASPSSGSATGTDLGTDLAVYGGRHGPRARPA